MDLKLPEWASVVPSGYPGAIEPPTGKKQEGWDNGEEPPAGYFNWAFQAIADVQNEVGNAITGTGGTLDGSVLTQLLGAFQRQRTIAALGCLRLAGDTGANQMLRAAARKASTRRVVVVGDNGTIASATSNEFVIEVAAGSPYTGDFQDVVYDSTLGLFVAVGTGGEIQSSPDGQTWSQRATGGSTVHAVATNGAGTLLAVGQTEYIRRSTNGTAWSVVTSPFAGTPHIRDVAFGAGLWVIVTGQGDVATSATGEAGSWTVRMALASTALGARIEYQSAFGFLYHYGTTVYRSADGITWTSLHNAMPTSSTTPGLCTTAHCWFIVSSSGIAGAYVDGRFSVATANAAADFSLDFVNGSDLLQWIGVLDGQIWALGGDGSGMDRVYVGGAV